MITIIGTIHVVNIAEPIMFFIKHIWPDAVLVELDVTRYNALQGNSSETDGDKADKMFEQTAKYQQKLAENNRSSVGNEMLTAVQTGKLVGAEIGLIDDDAMRTLQRAWDAMPFGERFRYRLSVIRDRFKGQKDVQRIIDNSKYADQAIEDMRRRYPNFVRVLVDERNEKMSAQIRDYAERFTNIVVVVGDAHVEGIADALSDLEVRKIRLADILDKDRLDKVRASLWNRGEENEGQVVGVHAER